MKNLKKNSIIFLVLALITIHENSSQAIDHDLQSWTTLVLQNSSENSFRTYFEFQPRFGSDLTKLERVLTRPAIGYKLTEHFTVWIGYGWTPLYTPKFLNEQRLWQQASYDMKWDQFSFLSRSRLEERFIEGVSQTAWRIRQLLRGHYKLTPDGPWGLVAQDEIFFHLNSPANGPEAGYDQNRLFIGPSYTPSPQLRYEGGYMINHVHNVSKDDRVNHIIQLSMIVTY